MKASELRERTDDELADELEGCKRELFNMRFQWQTEEASNPSQYPKLRRSIAQIKTVQRERQLGINADADTHQAASSTPEEEAEATPSD